MRWEDLRGGSNLQFRGGGGGGGVPIIGGGLGVVAIAVIAMFFGVDPRVVLQGAQQLPQQTQAVDPAQAEALQQTPEWRFADRINQSTEEVWTALFAQSGARYEPPTLNVFEGQVGTACGSGVAAMGPFYCPGDRSMYLDFSFFRELSSRFGAPGDFAQAYVIAHEVGHHVQNLTGANQEADRLGARGASSGSVRLELQADCYAGVWAFHANQRFQAERGVPLLEPGDVEEGLTAANAIGDDTLQREAQGRVAPDSFTHGSSAQRVRWFRVGLQSGDPARCDTFNARQL
ncbi:MAG: neutral zinc metallopeptidase [Proteobacteria bacterium]|nr:neutral zinc metallopeptidase [Pseudomonadota bacterium]